MKKGLIIIICLLCFGNSRAQMPDSTAITAEKLMLQQQRNDILKRIHVAKEDIHELRRTYTAREHDALFDETMQRLKADRQSARKAYRMWVQEEAAFIKKRALLDQSMMAYYKTQPFYTYRNKSRLNMAIGMGMAGAGGLLFMGGLVTGMIESPGDVSPTAVEQRTQRRHIAVVCFASATALALASIPFFSAARKNKARFKSHLTWDMDMRSVRLPNGLTREVVGFNCRIPLLSKTGSH
ncbi:hypothetical protein [Taibaiella koreensis]|uniref:hypothetical protein n=1 Tax=Taibaiella koreensis TaxID=1268548 RepID=UPI000E59E648|nr:hypothetical protein [Taibaiella koreensis]